MRKPTPSNALLNEHQLAEILSVSVKTLRSWRLAGNGPRYCKLGRRSVRYVPSVVEQWIEKQTRSSTSDQSGTSTP